jgi:histone H3/H4
LIDERKLKSAKILIQEKLKKICLGDLHKGGIKKIINKTMEFLRVEESQKEKFYQVLERDFDEILEKAIKGPS